MAKKTTSRKSDAKPQSTAVRNFSAATDIPLGDADAGLGGMFTETWLFKHWNSQKECAQPEQEFVAEIRHLVDELAQQPFKSVTNLCNWPNDKIAEYFGPLLRTASMYCGLNEEGLRAVHQRDPEVSAEIYKYFTTADHRLLLLAGLMMGARARLAALIGSEKTREVA